VIAATADGKRFSGELLEDVLTGVLTECHLQKNKKNKKQKE
jgi:hypothetical protein